MRRHAIAGRAFAWGLALVSACGGRGGAPVERPALAVLGDASVVRTADTTAGAAPSPWFDGQVIHLAAARGETVGVQVRARDPGPTRLTVPGVAIRGFAVSAVHVARGSTALYGGGRGAGDYADRLTAADAPATDPAYFEIAVPRDAAPGLVVGSLAVAGQAPVRVELAVSAAVMPPLPPAGVWAYEDPRELGWAGLPPSTLAAPSASERACVALFARYGVLLSPDLPVSAWPARRELLAGVPDVPATIPEEPAEAPAAVQAWIAATSGTHQVPFAIPIDEPRDAAAWAKVRALSAAVRASGGGPATFRYAVTAAPRPELGDAIDLFVSPGAAHLTGDAAPRWTYNGKPPQAGAMVVDADEPGLRTWGWIAWRYAIPTWYVWDALYWHDRHNRHGAPLPGRALDVTRDAASFDDGEDHGDLDGVLALPGDAATPCQPTLRLAALRRGLEDRALLTAASACDATATAAIAARVIPRALGDAPGDGAPAWPTSDAAFEVARREVLAIAARCAR